MLHFFGACSKKDWYRIESELKVVHGASTKWCVVHGAWPKTMVQNSTYNVILRTIPAPELYFSPMQMSNFLLKS